MNTFNNIALIFLRYTGCLFLFFAISNFLFVLSFVVLFLLGAPEWFTQIMAQSVVQSVIGGPIWILGGCLFIIFSQRLVKFIVKQCVPTIE